MVSPLVASLPYPELSPDHGRVVQAAWNFGRSNGRFAEDDVELAFHADCDVSLIQRLLDARLLASGGGIRPSALGLCYVTFDETAKPEQGARILPTLEALFQYVQEHYRPRAAAVALDEVAAHVGFSTTELARAAPYGRDLGLSLDLDSKQLHLSGDVARRGSLEAALTATGPAPSYIDAPHALRAGPAVPVRWTYIEVEQFRALRSLRLELASGLTVLVGPNSVGKSTVLDAAAFVGVATREGLDAALDRENGFERVRTRGCLGAVELRVGFAVDLGDGFRQGQYEFVLGETPGGMVVEDERLTVDGDEGPVPWLVGRRAIAKLQHPDRSVEELYRPLDGLTLPTLNDAAAHPVPVAVRWGLSRFVLLDRDPVMARPLSHGVGGILGPDGHRKRAAADAWRLLDEAIRDDAAAQRLGKALGQIVPTIIGARRRIVTGGLAEIELLEVGSEQFVGLDELSAGVRQMLLLTALYVHPDPPALILLEEPDAGLHAGAFPALRDLLRQIAERSTVLATTHSPFFVAQLDPSREVVALERDANAVRASTLADARDSRQWLTAYDPAEAFARAALERER